MDDDLLEQAGWWRLRLAQPTSDLGLQARFEAWRSASPEHEAAYRSVVEGVQAFDRSARDPAFAGPLAEARETGRRERASRADRHRGYAAVAATLVIAAGALALLQLGPGPVQEQVLGTSVGERRVFVLADGSRVSLDANARVTTRFSRHRRDLTLTSGQARFQAAHDVDRPFIVRVAGEDVRAVGTDFNIDLTSSRMAVTLISGRVAVSPSQPQGWLDTFWTRPPGRDAIQLDPGDQAIKPRGGQAVVSRNVAVQDAVAWQTGLLTLDNVTLQDAVERMNRYSARPIRIADSALAAKRIGGVFDTRTPEQFLAAVGAVFPVESRTLADNAIELRLRQEPRPARAAP